MLYYIIIIGLAVLVVGAVLKFAFKVAGCVLKGTLIAGLLLVVIGLVMLLVSSGSL